VKAAKTLSSLNFALKSITKCSGQYSLLNAPQLYQDSVAITSDSIFLYTPFINSQPATNSGSVSSYVDDGAGLNNGGNVPILSSSEVLQQMSISSLIIAAKAHSVLDSIQNSWPDFTALRNNQIGKAKKMQYIMYFTFWLF